ncbi:hypothetical protein ACQB60_25570 [Actinomycetota bacterium Odt1-20B]
MEDLYEIQLGVFAAPEALRGLVEGCTRVLEERGRPYGLKVAGQGSERSGGGMSIAEFYDELPEQWRVEHPGEDPGERENYEIRVGVVVTHAEMEELRDRLTRVACPDPGHASPCPVPWGTGHIRAGGVQDEEGVVEERFGHLRAR